MDSVD